VPFWELCQQHQAVDTSGLCANKLAQSSVGNPKPYWKQAPCISGAGGRLPSEAGSLQVPVPARVTQASWQVALSGKQTVETP